MAPSKPSKWKDPTVLGQLIGAIAVTSEKLGNGEAIAKLLNTTDVQVSPHAIDCLLSGFRAIGKDLKAAAVNGVEAGKVDGEEGEGDGAAVKDDKETAASTPKKRKPKAQTGGPKSKRAATAKAKSTKNKKANKAEPETKDDEAEDDSANKATPNGTKKETKRQSKKGTNKKVAAEEEEDMDEDEKDYAKAAEMEDAGKGVESTESGSGEEAAV